MARKKDTPQKAMMREFMQSYLKENDVKMIDFKMIDLDGRWRHISIPVTRFQPSLMTDGIGFDGRYCANSPPIFSGTDAVILFM